MILFVMFTAFNCFAPDRFKIESFSCLVVPSMEPPFAKENILLLKGSSVLYSALWILCLFVFPSPCLFCYFCQAFHVFALIMVVLSMFARRAMLHFGF